MVFSKAASGSWMFSKRRFGTSTLEETALHIFSEVRCKGETGVEMEALTAVSVAALTVYDMCKAVQRDMTITDIRLLYKEGGKSGVYERKDEHG